MLGIQQLLMYPVLVAIMINYFDQDNGTNQIMVKLQNGGHLQQPF